MKKRVIFIGVLTIILLVVNPVLAQIPEGVNYQGYLKDGAGDPVDDGVYPIKFTIYGSASGSDAVWNSGFQPIQVTNGLFTYLLGSNTPFGPDVWVGDTNRYLGITVELDPEITPRVKLVSAPFSHHAAYSDDLKIPANLETADDFNPVLRVQNIGDGGAVYGICPTGYAGHFTGDGRFTGDLTVDGTLNAPGLGDVTAVNAGTGLDGGGSSGDVTIYVKPDGITSSLIDNGTITNEDISVTADILRSKISGIAAAIQYTNHFESMNYFNNSVILENSDLVFRRSDLHRWRIKEESTHGIEFEQVYDDGGLLQNRTVFEIGDDGTIGVGGIDPDEQLSMHWNLNTPLTKYTQRLFHYNQGSGTMYGIKSWIQHSTAGSGGDSYGVHSTSKSDGDYRYGVYGYAEAQNLAITTGNSYGIMGKAYDGSVAYGVYGIASSATTNWAGYFSGNCRVTGTFDNSKSTMRIDHPLDPENKTLEHAYINSPEMLTVYSGNVTTDANGLAVVILPDYFESLNKDFRYQLTVIGSFADAIIKEKIEDNKFMVATSEPNIEVSWQVTGVRKDSFAESNPVMVEREKAEAEKGYYINPQAFGFDSTKSSEYATNAELMQRAESQE